MLLLMALVGSDTNDGHSLFMLSVTIGGGGTGVIAFGVTGLNEGRTAGHTTRGFSIAQLLEHPGGVADTARFCSIKDAGTVTGMTATFDRERAEDSSTNLGALAFGRLPGTAAIAKPVQAADGFGR